MRNSVGYKGKKSAEDGLITEMKKWTIGWDLKEQKSDQQITTLLSGGEQHEWT